MQNTRFVSRYATSLRISGDRIRVPGIELESQGANEVWAYMIEYVHSCIIDFVTEVKKTMEKPLCANPRSICVDCVKRQNCQNADTGVYILKCEEFENDD